MSVARHNAGAAIRAAAKGFSRRSFFFVHRQRRQGQVNTKFHILRNEHPSHTYIFHRRYIFRRIRAFVKLNGRLPAGTENPQETHTNRFSKPMFPAQVQRRGCSGIFRRHSPAWSISPAVMFLDDISAVLRRPNVFYTPIFFQPG